MAKTKKRIKRNKKYHYTYDIIDLLSGKHYIGVRSSNPPPDKDKYMGSSVPLKRVIKKEGVGNFKKIILRQFRSRKNAEIHECHLHRVHDVAKSCQYYNRRCNDKYTERDYDRMTGRDKSRQKSDKRAARADRRLDNIHLQNISIYL